MKKLALTFLTAVYLLFTIGVAVNQFYCCSKLKSVSFFLSNNDQGTCKNETNNDECCKTKHHYLKVDDSHFASNAIFLAKKHCSILHVNFPIVEFNVPPIHQAFELYNINAPPGITKTPVYVFNCNFRI